jgi:hypothetical protein
MSRKHATRLLRGARDGPIVQAAARQAGACCARCRQALRRRDIHVVVFIL